MRHARILKSTWFAFTLVALGGCLSSPKNGDSIPAKAAQLDFEGYNPDSPTATITLFALNNSTSQWTQLAHPPILVDPTPHTDNAGTTWYKFKATDVVLQRFRGELTLLDSKGGGRGEGDYDSGYAQSGGSFGRSSPMERGPSERRPAPAGKLSDALDDDIPF